MLKKFMSVLMSAIMCMGFIPTNGSLLRSYAAETTSTTETYTGPSLEDIKAIQAFCLNADYVGNGRVLDINEDGRIDVFDLTLAKQQLIKSGAPTLTDFKADTFGIYLNEKTPTTFTVNVAAITPIKQNAISVYDADGNHIAYMHDDGKNGDVIANDNVYSAQVDLISDEIKLVEYHAATDQVSSEPYEVCFYRDLEEDEYSGFIKLHETITGLSFEAACEYVKNSDEILSYDIDDSTNTISYRSKYYIYGMWTPERSSDVFGTGMLSLPDTYVTDFLNGEDVFAEFETALDLLSTVPVHDNKKGVAVIRPFHGSDFSQFNQMEQIGELVANALDTDITVFDDSDASLSNFKKLNQYSVILLETHGGIVPGTDTPYLLTGEQWYEDSTQSFIISLKSLGYDLEIISGNLFDSGHDHRLGVTGKFFDYHYTKPSTGTEYDMNDSSNELLTDSFWFLGACNSLHDSSIADALISHGAGAVVGFTNTVNGSYLYPTCIETILNSMILSSDSVYNGVKESKRIVGNFDSYNPDTTIAFYGKRNYRLVNQIYGNYNGIVQRSDNDLPIANAIVQVYWNEQLIKETNVNNSGSFSLYLPVGVYKIKISAPGYNDFDGFIQVKEVSLNKAKYSLTPNAFDDGMPYWVAFYEGYRSGRLEMSTFDATDGYKVTWNRNLKVTNQSGKCNQYYYNGTEWVKIGTYGILTDYAMDIVASNVDIYDSSGNLIFEKTNSSFESIDFSNYTK